MDSNGCNFLIFFTWAFNRWITFMPNVSFSHVFLALSLVGLVLLLLFLILVLLDLMGALGNKMIGASTVVACSLLLVWELLLHNFVTLLLEPVLESSHEESKIFNLLILLTIAFFLTWWWCCLHLFLDLHRCLWLASWCFFVWLGLASRGLLGWFIGLECNILDLHAI